MIEIHSTVESYLADKNPQIKLKCHRDLCKYEPIDIEMSLILFWTVSEMNEEDSLMKIQWSCIWINPISAQTSQLNLTKWDIHFIVTHVKEITALFVLCEHKHHNFLF